MQVHLPPILLFVACSLTGQTVRACVFLFYWRWVGRVSLRLLSFLLSADLNAFDQASLERGNQGSDLFKLATPDCNSGLIR